MWVSHSQSVRKRVTSAATATLRSPFQEDTMNGTLAQYYMQHEAWTSTTWNLTQSLKLANGGNIICALHRLVRQERKQRVCIPHKASRVFDQECDYTVCKEH
eukprot:1255362-Amphidinium_carterae.1